MITSLIILLGLLIGIHMGFQFNQNIYHGPNSNKVKKMIFQEGNKCYKLVPIIHICPIRMSMK